MACRNAATALVETSCDAIQDIDFHACSCFELDCVTVLAGGDVSPQRCSKQCSACIAGIPGATAYHSSVVVNDEDLPDADAWKLICSVSVI
eukprot:601858-Amphidinium_carterae.1